LEAEGDVRLCPIVRHDFPALQGKPDAFRYAHEKDFYQWWILNRYGGVYMDLDTFSLKDSIYMLDDSCEVVAALESNDIDDYEAGLHIGVVMSKRRSGIISEILTKARDILEQDDMKWADTGPPLFSIVCKREENRPKVKFTDWGVLGGHGNKVVGLNRPDGYIWDQAHILHLYAAGGTSEWFNAISERYIQESNAKFANIVRETLDPADWDPLGRCIDEVDESIYYKSIEVQEKQQANRLAQILIETYNPKSVVDFGCATGLYLVPFKINGAFVLGFDKSRVALDFSEIPDHIEVTDIGQKVLSVHKVDLVICLETMEHIDPKNEAMALDNVCAPSDIVIFSAAFPGQGGEGHINCQPKEYWIERFRERGFIVDQNATDRIISFIKQGPHLGWLTINLMVMVRMETKIVSVMPEDDRDVYYVHFVNTGPDFPYTYYIGIMTALK